MTLSNELAHATLLCVCVMFQRQRFQCKVACWVSMNLVSDNDFEGGTTLFLKKNGQGTVSQKVVFLPGFLCILSS